MEPELTDQIHSALQHPLLCCEMHPVKIVCSRKSCLSPSFLCGEQSCICSKNHSSLCQFLKISQFMEKLKVNVIEKQKNKSNYRLKLKRDFEEFFEKLHRYNQLVFDGIQKVEKLEKSAQQQLLLQRIQQQKNNEITGDLISKVLKESSEQKLSDEMKREVSKQVQQSYESFSKIVEVSSEIIRNKLYATILNFDSKILSSSEDIRTINQFFEKKVKRYNFIFRATEHNFDLNYFFSSYKGTKNTLFLAKTSLGKIIGGFVQGQLIKRQAYKEPKEIIGQKFVFSVDQRKKYIPKEPQHQLAIVVYGSSISFGSLEYDKYVDFAVNDSIKYFTCNFGHGNFYGQVCINEKGQKQFKYISSKKFEEEKNQHQKNGKLLKQFFNDE